jgi:hypothetical protein
MGGAAQRSSAATSVTRGASGRGNGMYPKAESALRPSTALAALAALRMTQIERCPSRSDFRVLINAHATVRLEAGAAGLQTIAFGELMLHTPDVRSLR